MCIRGVRDSALNPRNIYIINEHLQALLVKYKVSHVLTQWFVT